MSFDSKPLIQTTVLQRETRVSERRMTSAIDKLTKAGEIAPCRTPTNRKFLSVRDAELVFDEIVGEHRRIAL